MKRRAGAILMAAALLLGAGGGQAAEQAPQKLRRAPDFTLRDWQGKPVSLRDYKGQVVLLQFFQTGCPTCRHEAPLLEQVYRDHQEDGVVFIGISHDQNAPQVLKTFAAEFNLTYPLLLGDLEVAVRYVGITPQQSSFKIPHFFLIDREGYIVREFAPDRDPEFFQDEKKSLEQALKQVLAGSNSDRPRERIVPD